MAEIVRIGSGGAYERELFVVEAACPGDVPDVLPLPCLLVPRSSQAF
jgi:hypothetical protein